MTKVVWSKPVGEFADDNDKLKEEFRSQVRGLFGQKLYITHLLQTGYESCTIDGWKTAVGGSMEKAKEYTVAVVVKLASSEGAVRAFDKEGELAKAILTKPTSENAGKVEMLFLSSGCDALATGQPSVKYIRKA